MSQVLVLNAGYEPMTRVSVKKAIKMLLRGVAEIEDVIEGEMFGPFQTPASVRLTRYVQMKWMRGDVVPRINKKRLLARDHNTCAYCGKRATEAEHVLPKSRGGKLTWKNAVAACERCNRRKDDKTPEEAGMRLLWQPWEPTWAELGMVAPRIETRATYG